MDWHCLGHAMWLAEVGHPGSTPELQGLRLLFDPLLDDVHHGGVFEVSPGRVLDAEALRPDFILVSHRHPDHFDLASLRTLAALDPDTVVVTPDELVASCARRLGFRTVRVVPAETTIDLDGVRLITTPSLDVVDPEWGILVANDEGVVYDQIDTSLGKPDDVRVFFTRAAAALGRDAKDLVTLALTRWQPLLEIEAVLGGAIGFPFRAYAEEIERCAAVQARVVCPSAAGARHAGPYAFMNALVYPATERRFIEDVRARLPGVRVEPHVTGASYRVRGGEVVVDPRGASELVTVRAVAAPDPRSFRPLEIPSLVDPNIDDRDEVSLRSRIDGWVHAELSPALVRASYGRPLRYLLEVVLPNTVDRYAIRTGPSSASVARADDAEWDVRCAVAGSLLVDVLDGRRHWGDLLLGGMLRGCSRACEVDARGVRPIPLQPLFVYEALGYEASVIQALEHQLELWKT